MRAELHAARHPRGRNRTIHNTRCSAQLDRRLTRKAGLAGSRASKAYRRQNEAYFAFLLKPSSIDAAQYL